MIKLTEETKLKVYFDEEWDSLTYNLRIDKRKEEDVGFHIPKEKYQWIKKTEEEYFKTQDYIKGKLISKDLI